MQRPRLHRLHEHLLAGQRYLAGLLELGLEALAELSVEYTFTRMRFSVSWLTTRHPPRRQKL